jgi:hypothetical protein
MTIKELDKERPPIIPETTREINYENAIHPYRTISQSHNKGAIINPIHAKALFEKTIQKPLSIVGKILTDFNQDIQEHVSNQFDFNHNNNNDSDNNNNNNNNAPLSDVVDPSPSHNNASANTANVSQRSVFGERSFYNTIPDDNNGGIGIHNEMMTMGTYRMERSLSLESTSSHNSRDYTRVQQEVEQITDKDIQKSLESLKSMFPNSESDLCEEVFYGKNCNINEAVDKLLELSEFLNTESEYGDRDAVDFIDLNKLSLDSENKDSENNNNVDDDVNKNNNIENNNNHNNEEKKEVEKEKEKERKKEN